MLFTKGVDPDDDQNTEPVIAAAQPAVDTISPDIDPFIATKISLARFIVFRSPLAFQP